jgi:iron complex outermembrane receptor protein
MSDDGAMKWLSAPVTVLVSVTCLVALPRTGVATEIGLEAVPVSSERIVVTATRTSRTIGDVPMSVTVVGPEDIARSPTKTLDELLRSDPSFTLFRRSSSVAADPSSQGVKLRNVGASGISRALVLVDGIPANDPFGGWVAWRSIPRIGLERIEIVPGGGSSLYGNYALGGVIQAFTRPIEPDDVNLTAEYGTADTALVAGRAADRWGSVGGSIEGELFTSNGYPVVADYARGSIDGETPSDHATLNARLEAAASPQLRFDVTGGYFSEDLNAGTKYTTAAMQRAEFAGGAHYTPDQAGAFDLSLFGHQGEFQQDRARVGPGRNTEELSAHQEVPTSDLGASLLWSSPNWQFGGTHALTVGTDARWIDGTTRERLYPATIALPSNPTVQRNARGKQRLYGVFVEDLYDYSEAITASVAVRYDRWENLSGSRNETANDGTVTSTEFSDRSGGEFSPKVGLRTTLTDWLTARTTAYRSFRAPTLDELYRPFQAGTVRTNSNENLTPETLRGAEAGFDVGGQRGPTARLTAFWNEMQDPILNVSTGPGTRQRQNLGKARIQGIEFDGTWAFAPGWSVDAAYTLADTEITDAPGQPQLLGNQLPQAPRHLANVSLAFDDPSLLTANVQLRYLGKQFENDVNTLPMEDALLVDLFANWHVGNRIDLYLAVENLFDTEYLVGRSGVDTIGQPRFIHGGVRLRIGQ